MAAEQTVVLGRERGGEMERLLGVDVDLLAKRRNEQEAKRRAKWPKPELGDIEDFWEDGKSTHSALHDRIRYGRRYRFMRDMMPEKWAKELEIAPEQAFRSRLVHNEIMRVVAMADRNPPKVVVPSTGSRAVDEKQSEKQTRWSSNFFTAIERANGPVKRMFIDSMMADALGVWEFALTDAYDNLGERLPEETDREYLARTDKEMRSAGLPFEVRHVDPTSLYFEERSGKLGHRVAIAERKPYRQVFHDVVNTLGGERLRDVGLPQPGDKGWPIYLGESWSGDQEAGRRGTVETVRYYDGYWYMWVVGGVVVDVRPHGFPRVPVIIAPGMVTSSPFMSERYQGICWGMEQMAAQLDYLTTLDIDRIFRYGGPKAVVEIDANSRISSEELENLPPIDLRQRDFATYLPPGAHIVDINAQFRSESPIERQNFLLGMFQRNGLNPIATGESPGADPAGYTVNTLQGAAQAMYETALDNFARACGELIDLARLTVRDTIQDRTYLAAPLDKVAKRDTDWLVLEPEDVDETPCIVTIDPLSDSNRIAIRQSLQQGNKEGYVTRRRVQVQGFGVDDPDAEDDALIREKLEAQLAESAVQDALAIVRLEMQQQAQPQQPQPQGPVILGPDGQPLPPSGAMQGAMPAPPQAPTVGGGQAMASRPPGGPADMPAGQALAGQGSPSRVSLS